MPIRKHLGEKIRVLRQKINITQQQMAEMIGVESPSYLSKIERGEASPSYELLARIAKTLGVSLKELFDISSETTKTKEMSALDKWLLRFRSVLKGQKEKDIKAAYYIVRKILVGK